MPLPGSLPISLLPAASSLTGVEPFPCVQSGTTKRTTLNTIKTYVLTAVPVSSLQSFSNGLVYTSAGTGTVDPNIYPTGSGSLLATVSMTSGQFYGGGGNLTDLSSGQINCVTDGSDASTGILGEFIYAENLTPTNFTSDGPIEICSIALSAGDWDVWGFAKWTIALHDVKRLTSEMGESGSLVSYGALFTVAQSNIWTPGAETLYWDQVLPVRRFSLTVGLSPALICDPLHVSTEGDVTAIGFLCARRVR